MDLGPFLQNFVMKNPFKNDVDRTVDGRSAGDRAGGQLTRRWQGGSVPLMASWTFRPRRRAAKAGVMVNGVDNGEKVESTDVLVENSDSSCHRDVTVW